MIRASAMGVGRFLRPTGESCGLQVEERRDPVRATDAGARRGDATPDSDLIITQQRSLVTRHALRPMSDTEPKHAGFDRAAAAILGSMITLIVALGFVLLEASVESNPAHVPMAAATDLTGRP